MSAADIQAKAFTDDDVAREAIEALMWPNGPVCPHCGSTAKSARSKASRRALASTTAAIARSSSRSRSEPSSSAPRFRCPNGGWRSTFMASSRRACRAHQLHRMLGVTYQTAWFMEHRIREAMRDGALSPMGGEGSIVEIDETFIGRKDGFEAKRGVRSQERGPDAC